MDLNLAKIFGIEKFSGTKIDVLCFGHFNVIHPGHLRYLQFAADGGGTLVGIGLERTTRIEVEV